MSKFKSPIRRIFRSREPKPQSSSAEDSPAPITEANLAPEEPSPPAIVKPQATSTRNKEKYGLFVLVDQPSERKGGVDIVAIHGLNGHYLETWTGEGSGSGQRYSWLENALPEEIPTARIMSFGYDSAIFSRSVADNYDYAQQLLELLWAKQRTAAEKTRPIMFLCHSLGGIIFKKALIQAHERSRRYEELLKNVKGVAFFGTPHRGSDVANWATLLGNLVQLMPISMHKATLDGLKKNSGYLLGISQSFVERGAGLNITSFYETYKLGGANLVIVPKDSALLQLPNENPIPLNGDHRSICRFAGKDEQRLGMVLANIRSMVDDQVSRNPLSEIRLSPEHTKCLQELYPGNYEAFKDFNVTRTPGTCEWLLKHRQYTKWINESQSSLLWISANAGCGKSTLAKFLIEHLKATTSSTDERQIVCHFFFKDGIPEQQSVVLTLRAILHQIISHNKTLGKHLFSQYERKGSAVMTEFDSLFRILTEMISDTESAGIICILDGMDECPKPDATKLLRALSKFYQEQESAKPQEEIQQQPRQMHYLKLVVLSRPELVIESAFRKYQHTIRLKGEDETKTIENDISLVIKQCIVDLQEEMKIPTRVLDDFSKRLEAKADGTFLWATLVMRILQDRCQSDGGISESETLDLLHGRDVFSVYRHMLRNIKAKPDSIKMLQIIYVAERPLSIEEMNVALAVLPSQQTLKDISLNMKYPQEDYVKALCGNFVRFIHGKIHLVHQTAREFLGRTDAEGAMENSWQNSISYTEAYKTLFRACIFYLSCGERSAWEESESLKEPAPRFEFENHVLDFKRSNDFEDSIAQLNEFQKLECIHPFLNYAANNWYCHWIFMKRPILDMDIYRQMVEFCQPVPSRSGYPLWTLVQPNKLSSNKFGGAYWDEGRELSHFEKRARIIFSINNEGLSQYFCRHHYQDKLDNGNSLLHLAVGMNSIWGCDYLTYHGADINARNTESKTPLTIAFENCSLYAAGTLIDDGGSVAFSDGAEYGELRCLEHNRAVVHCAIRDNEYGLAQFLIETGSKLDSRDAEGHTPIWCAFNEGHSDWVEELIPCSTDPESRKNAEREAANLTTVSTEVSMEEYDNPDAMAWE